MKVTGIEGAVAAGLACATMTLAPSIASAQQNVLRPNTAQVARQMPQTSEGETAECSAVMVHITRLGVAFQCTDPSGITRYTFVVESSQFPDRPEYVLDLLDKFEARGTSGSTRTNRRGLHVRFRDASMNSQTICGMARMDDSATECREAVDVGF